MSVGSVIQWRGMAWSPGVILSHQSVLVWTTHSHGRSWRPLRSGMVRCCGGGFHPGDGMCEMLLIGALLRELWGRKLGHVVSRLLSGPLLLQP